MTAYIIVDLTPIDTEKLQQYSAMAAETLIPFNGEFIAKGSIEALHGEQNFQTKVIIGFPDHDSAMGWYNSDAYQEIIDLRNQGMKSQFHIIG